MNSRLSEDDINQIASKTKLNSSLIMDYFQRFNKRFPNGYLNKQEFNEIALKLMIKNEITVESDEEKNSKLDLCKRIFDLCDCDYNGKIDFKEYFLHFFTRTKGDSQQKLELIFDIFDSDHNNQLDFNEIHTIVKLLLKLKHIDSDNENDMNDFNNFKAEIFKNQVCINLNLPISYHTSLYIMKKFDSNKNGKISKSEFIKGCVTEPKIRNFLTPIKFI